MLSLQSVFFSSITFLTNLKKFLFNIAILCTILPFLSISVSDQLKLFLSIPGCPLDYNWSITSINNS